MFTTASPRHFHLIRCGNGDGVVEVEDLAGRSALPHYAFLDESPPTCFDWGTLSPLTFHTAESILYAVVKRHYLTDYLSEEFGGHVLAMLDRERCYHVCEAELLTWISARVAAQKVGASLMDAVRRTAK